MTPASAPGDRSGRGERDAQRRGAARAGGDAKAASPRRQPGAGQRGARPHTGRPERDGQAEARRGGARLAPTSSRLPEPAIPEGVTGAELDRSVHAQLRTLSKENAQGVAQHLVMVATLLGDDLPGAEAHAETAVRRAGRVPAAREALGLVAYRKGDWAKALSEFRTVRRLSGSSHLLPMMVDCERGLGRLERALDLAASSEAASLSREERVELAIVVSGIRRDLGQPDAALQVLQIPELKAPGARPWSARLDYAYAEALLARGDQEGARAWFARAVDLDEEAETDAADRLTELDGIRLQDLEEDGA